MCETNDWLKGIQQPGEEIYENFCPQYRKKVSQHFVEYAFKSAHENINNHIINLLLKFTTVRTSSQKCLQTLGILPTSVIVEEVRETLGVCNSNFFLVKIEALAGLNIAILTFVIGLNVIEDYIRSSHKKCYNQTEFPLRLDYISMNLVEIMQNYLHCIVMAGLVWLQHGADGGGGGGGGGGSGVAIASLRNVNHPSYPLCKK
uniref:Uncharacterized protein n=1 Tax=Glossina palpalis gambiensis TaxID=67801 RepID=A0A1B0B1P4_9MUSC